MNQEKVVIKKVLIKEKSQVATTPQEQEKLEPKTEGKQPRKWL